MDLRVICRWLLTAALGLFASTALHGQSGAIEVDLELLLAVDISRSVDDEEARLQREGYIAAFSDPRVIEAIQSGPLGAIAVAYVEWAGVDYQRTSIDWMLLRSREDVGAFARQLLELPRTAASWTSISGAIDHSVRVFERNPHRGMRRIIDISGDGVNNSGRPAGEARDAAVAAGLTINGLPILNDRPNFGRPAQKNLDRYYESEVIGGPGAFVIAAEDYRDFGRAILAKLLLEIAGAPKNGAKAEMSAIPASTE